MNKLSLLKRFGKVINDTGTFAEVLTETKNVCPCYNPIVGYDRLSSIAYHTEHPELPQCVQGEVYQMENRFFIKGLLLDNLNGRKDALMNLHSRLQYVLSEFGEYTSDDRLFISFGIVDVFKNTTKIIVDEEKFTVREVRVQKEMNMELFTFILLRRDDTQ